MDRGMLEINPTLIKLEYCIAISEEIQKEMVDTISRLIGQNVKIVSPTPGSYPEDEPSSYKRNAVIIDTEKSSAWNSEVVKFSLRELPGCCGVLVSYNTSVGKLYRGKGINQYLQGVKERIARENGYTLIMATTTSDNNAEIHILEKFGWKLKEEFRNQRTGNLVLVYTKEISYG